MMKVLAADTDCDGVASVDANPKPAGWKRLTSFHEPFPPEQLTPAGFLRSFVADRCSLHLKGDFPLGRGAGKAVWILQKMNVLLPSRQLSSHPR